MGIEETKILACKSVYWICMNADIENHITNCSTCLDFQQTQLKEKFIHHEIPGKLWEVLGADMFTLNNKNYLCIVDYHSKFPVIKKTEDLSTYNLMLTCKIIFSEYGLPKKINVRHRW